MLVLPKRESEFMVVVDEESGAAFRMASFTDERAIEVITELGLDRVVPGQDLLEIKVPYGMILRLFAQQVRGAEELLIGSEPFDWTNPEHVASVPRQLRIKAVTGLITRDLTLTEDSRKNSAAPAEPLPEDTIPSEASTGANSLSS